MADLEKDEAQAQLKCKLLAVKTAQAALALREAEVNNARALFEKAEAKAAKAWEIAQTLRSAADEIAALC